MNLFYLDKDHDKNAQYHVDKHVVKMILEAAEMLCMAHYVYEVLGFVPRKLEKEEYEQVCKYKRQFREVPPAERPIPYIGRDAHLNHPSTIWVRSSKENYAWTWCYIESLEAERKFRNPNGVQQHTAVRLCRQLPELDIPDVGFTPFALAMKAMLDKHPHLVHEDDPILSYRNFYMLDKATFASWKARDKPEWWDEDLAAYEDRVSGK